MKTYNDFLLRRWGRFWILLD